MAVSVLDGGDALPGVFRWKLIGSVALALVPHAALLFGGHWILQALKRVRVNRVLSRQRSNTAHHDDVAGKEELLAVEAYLRYVQIWRRLNADPNHPPVAFGPFDSLLAELIKTRFGGPPSPDSAVAA
jgi:hypothetical protein